MNAARYYNITATEPGTDPAAENATTGNITTTIDPETLDTIITNAATNANTTSTSNPFTAMGLDLRVPMPEHVPGLPTPASRASPAPRQRTTSGM